MHCVIADSNHLLQYTLLSKTSIENISCLHVSNAKEMQLSQFACRVMLSDKLLSKTDYNCDREIRTLELLKLRFGDANLHNCEASCQH